MDDVKGKLSDPVFIVGRPRSGTKLLRDLLKRNPEIGIPSSETSFWPKLINKFGVNQDFQSRKTRHELVEEFLKTSFVRFSGMLIDKRSIIDNECHIHCWNDVFRCLLAPYVETTKVIGDKTPDYLFAINILLNSFDNVKFIHIIRDPRDCALSARRVWDKDLYRVVAQWEKGMSFVSVLQNSEILTCANYIECHYEELITNSKDVLRNICNFLGVGFVDEMNYLKTPSENYGDARGQTAIMKNNFSKYKTQLTHAEIKRIEEISFTGLICQGYEIQYAKEYKPMNIVEYLMRYFCDVINIIKFRIRDEGLVHGISTQMILFFERLSNRLTRKI